MLVSGDLGLLPAAAQESTAIRFRPNDPIASIDGEPILYGELNYLVSSRLKVNDLSRVRPEVLQASSALLVRQHMALKSLKEQGGQKLDATLDRAWSRFQSQLQRSGRDVESFCNSHSTNVESVRHAIHWDAAWRAYLKSRLTDANLRRYYEANRAVYAPSKWRVSHLFLPIEAGDAKQEDEVTDQVKTIYRELKEIDDDVEELELRFAELARDHSHGSTSGDGGVLGWVSDEGDLPKSVMASVRRSKPGSLIAPIRSPLGFHLVLVHEKASSDAAYADLPDRGPLQRDAADALFKSLLSRQSSANVVWHLAHLKPPQSSESQE